MSQTDVTVPARKKGERAIRDNIVSKAVALTLLRDKFYDEGPYKDKAILAAKNKEIDQALSALEWAVDDLLDLRAKRRAKRKKS